MFGDEGPMLSEKFATAAIALLLTVCGLISCGSGDSHDYASLNLAGPWKLIVSDGDAPADSRFDDSNAGEIMIPGKWDRVVYNNEDLVSTIWIRKKIIIGREFTDRMLVLSLGSVALVDEAYINGAFIGGTGDFPTKEKPLNYTFALHRERAYRFPPSMVRFDGENIIAIKIFSHYINGIKDNPELFRITDWNEKNWLKEYLPSFNNLNPIILSVLLLLFLGVIIKGSGNRNLTAYALIFILSVFVINLLILGLPRMENNLCRFKLFYGLYAIVDYVLLLLIQEFFNIRSRAFTAMFTLLLVADWLLIVYAPSTRFFISYAGNATVALVILYIIYSLGIFFIALYRDPRRYWYLTFVSVFILVSVITMWYTMITHQMYKMSFSFALRLPAILLGAVFVYLFDLKNVKKERDSLAKALMNKTKQLQRANKALSSAVIKPEPRDIIHDLIEYLDNNFNQTYDRIKLAERFKLNEDYMGQLFKKVTNTNIANYINTKRIEAAKLLLKETDSKVIDIAFHVGFDNLTYFYRHFKKHTGYSPIEYKRMARNALPDMDGVINDETY
jgi:two-component system response regulator YesN